MYQIINIPTQMIAAIKYEGSLEEFYGRNSSGDLYRNQY